VAVWDGERESITSWKEVILDLKGRGRGRPRKHPVPSVEGRSAEAFIAALPKKRWRDGTKGPLSARVRAVRIRMGEGRKIARGNRLPVDLEQWLVCDERKNGERRYYLSNAPADTPRIELVRPIKRRWSCKQAHQQMKQELGLDHYEARSGRGLPHHALLSMIAFCFLQYLRLKRTRKSSARKGREPPCRKGRKVRCPNAARVLRQNLLSPPSDVHSSACSSENRCPDLSADVSS
jgi:SRSO17 transposase